MFSAKNTPYIFASLQPHKIVLQALTTNNGRICLLAEWEQTFKYSLFSEKLFCVPTIFKIFVDFINKNELNRAHLYVHIQPNTSNAPSPFWLLQCACALSKNGSIIDYITTSPFPSSELFYGHKAKSLRLFASHQHNMLSLFSPSFLLKKTKISILFFLGILVAGGALGALFYTSINKQVLSTQRLGNSYAKQLNDLAYLHSGSQQKLLFAGKQLEDSLTCVRNWKNASNLLYVVFSEISQNIPPSYSLSRLTIEIPSGKNHVPGLSTTFSLEGRVKELANAQLLLLNLHRALPEATFSIQDIKRTSSGKAGKTKTKYNILIDGTAPLLPQPSSSQNSRIKG